MDEPRILTGEETHQRRREQASSMGPKIVDLCAHDSCPNPVNHGPYCADHRRSQPTIATVELNPEQLAKVKAQVEADAAILFVLAMNWISRQQLTQLGVDTNSLAAGIDRIRAELTTPEKSA